jgi:23S rRNA (cytidine1920-2'-O)/16S rRNA (cytidine1409-2'-O)-methyltransferase
VAEPEADYVLLVKPQFEAGKSDVPRGGVVRDPGVWAGSISKVVRAAEDEGLGLLAVVPSAVPGPAGNKEFFVHLKRGVTSGSGMIEDAMREVE